MSAALHVTAHAVLIATILQLIAGHPQLGHLLVPPATSQQLAPQLGLPPALQLGLRSTETVPWASATFQGERHKLEFAVQSLRAVPYDTMPAPPFGAADAACALVDLMERTRTDPDGLRLPGHALIDVTFEGIETLSGPNPMAQTMALDPASPPGQAPQAQGCVVRFAVLTLVDQPAGLPPAPGRRTA